jgi:2-C-methyl-D-erythritol 2,4-cyclodiphosphate synthase
VEIPSDLGLDGHSDADVLLHALTDALLGALALGDIGDWFPNTDEQWRGASSARFVVAARNAIAERGWRVVNLDSTIHAERPKLSAYKRTIAERLAELLEIAPEQVSVKAKTGEKVGPVGRCECIDADVIVLLEKVENL